MAPRRNYLVGVLGLSALPRILTFGLTLVSFPLMVTALGATEYGVIVFLTAITSVLESGADLGVSSAAGKNIADARESRANSVRGEVHRWIQLQSTVAVIGLLPLVGLTYIIAERTSTIEVSVGLVVIVVLASWFNIALNFARAALTSLLQFRLLAIVDTVESLGRSSAFVFIAYKFPTARGLAIATLVTAIGSGVIGTMCLMYALRKHPPRVGGDGAVATPLSLRYMLHESANFFWLRLATRAYHSGPLVVIGKIFGAEVVGVIGALQKIIDMLNFPAAVVGNALAVRANGIIAKGTQAVQALWDAASRFIATSVLAAATFYFGADILARLLVKDSPDAARYIAILSLSVTNTAIASLIVPMSDYVGALRSRNILLTVAAAVQVPILWLASRGSGPTGAVGAYVAVQTLVTCGYLYIALRVFYRGSKYRMRAELGYLVFLMATALAVAAVVPHLSVTAALPTLRWHGQSLTPIVLLWGIVLIGLPLNRLTRQYFLSMRFFDFESADASTDAKAHDVRSVLR